MWTGTIREDGDGPRRKGTPPAHRLVIEMDGGSGPPLSVRLGRPGPADATANLICEIGYREFPVCPICLERGPSSREHVPQGSVGGHVRTLTCERCNNGLGSRLEAEFTDWVFDRLVHVGAEGDPVPGRRRIPRIYRRWTNQGEFVWLLDGPIDPGVREMLANGGISMSFRLPDPARWRLAALKHAYLAACCHLGVIPDTADAEQIRTLLVSARTGLPSRTGVPCVAAVLGIGRSDGPPQGPPLALMAAPGGALGGAAEPWISLAGVVLVRWPMPDAPPRM